MIWNKNKVSIICLHDNKKTRDNYQRIYWKTKLSSNTDIEKKIPICHLFIEWVDINNDQIWMRYYLKYSSINRLHGIIWRIDY